MSWAFFFHSFTFPSSSTHHILLSHSSTVGYVTFWSLPLSVITRQEALSECHDNGRDLGPSRSEDSSSVTWLVGMPSLMAHGLHSYSVVFYSVEFLIIPASLAPTSQSDFSQSVYCGTTTQQHTRAY